MSTPIPLILCGKIPSHQAAVPEALKPEYEVVGAFNNVESFASTFPALLSSKTKRPAAIFMGGGFDHNEFNLAYAVPGASSIPWLRPIRMKPGNEHMLVPLDQAPPADKVAAVARKVADEHVEILRAGAGAGEIWYY